MGYYEKDEWGYITGYVPDWKPDCETCKKEELYQRWSKICGNPGCGYYRSWLAKRKNIGK